MTPPRKLKPFNPFYPLLVLFGVVFCITACAYGVMTVKGLQPDAAASAGTASGRHLLAWLDTNGFKLMMFELTALALATVTAIGTDEFWERRHRQARSETQIAESGEPME